MYLTPEAATLLDDYRMSFGSMSSCRLLGGPLQQFLYLSRSGKPPKCPNKAIMELQVQLEVQW